MPGSPDHSWFINQIVAAKEELGDVSAQVVLKIESATGVDFDEIRLQLEHQIVKDEQFSSLFDLVIDLLGAELLDFTCNLGSLNLAL
jgi:hypothetical protein